MERASTASGFQSNPSAFQLVDNTHIPAFATPYSKYSVLLDPVVETFNSLKFTSIIYVEKVMDHVLNLFLIRKLEIG